MPGAAHHFPGKARAVSAVPDTPGAYTAPMTLPLARPLLSTERLLLLAPEPSQAAEVCDFQGRNRAHFQRWDPPTGE